MRAMLAVAMVVPAVHATTCTINPECDCTPDNANDIRDYSCHCTGAPPADQCSDQCEPASKTKEYECRIEFLKIEKEKAEKLAESCSPTTSPSEYHPCHYIMPGSQAFDKDLGNGAQYNDDGTRTADGASGAAGKIAWKINEHLGPFDAGHGNKLAVTCCPNLVQTSPKSIGSRAGCNSLALQDGATYDEASAHCHSQGMVVCSVAQMAAEVGQNDQDDICPHLNARHHWTSDATDCPDPTRAPVTQYPKKQISGDPFVTNADGSKTQLWLPLRANRKGLPTSAEETLLQCPTFTLYGRVMGTGIKNDHQQWFDQFRIVAHGKEQLRVGVQSATATNATDRSLNMLDLAVEGDNVRRTGSAVAAGGVVSVWKDQRDDTVENVQFSTDQSAVVIQIQSAVAQKFIDAHEQRKYTHLDLAFNQMNSKGCTGGTLAEIWGVVPMTQETAKKLEPHYIIDG